MSDKREHWETIFETKSEKEVSWFQEKPETSLQLIKACKLSLDAKIIDIGGGDSFLIDNLIDLGYTNLYLLDISENAINKVKARLGDKAKLVNFLVTDVLDYQIENEFDIWHDRASFHFLLEDSEVEKYKNNVVRALKDKSNLIIGAFSDEGPLKCSGLPITQYTVEKMEAVFENDFQLENCFTEEHETPFESVQDFIFCHYKKK
jgi:SAM-dependent methyltransferase